MDTQQKIMVATACISAFASLITLFAFTYTWRSGRWNSEAQANRSRAKIKAILYKDWFWKKEPIYINPLDYYDGVKDDEFLKRHIPFQSSDLVMKVREGLRDPIAHKYFTTKFFNLSLYDEKGKMSLYNLKNFNSLIVFLDGQLNGYITYRAEHHLSMWNMLKWKRFLWAIRKQLRTLKRKLEALPTNLINFNVEMKAAKKSAKPFKGTVNFLYSFGMKDYSGKTIDYKEGADQEARKTNDPISNMMLDFSGFYQRESIVQFKRALDNAFNLHLDLLMQWKQSAECVNINEYMNMYKNANKLKNFHEDDFKGDESVKWANDIQYYKHQHAETGDIHLEEMKPATYSGANAFLKLHNARFTDKDGKVKYNINRQTLDAAKIDKENDDLTYKDMWNIVNNAFIKGVYGEVNNIEELPFCNSQILKDKNEALLHIDFGHDTPNTKNLAYSLNKDSEELPETTAKFYSLEEQQFVNEFNNKKTHKKSTRK